MIIRFIIYGILGWTMEIIWTGLISLLQGNWQLPGVTYLWMFPIYGLAIFLEPMHDRLSSVNVIIRGLLYLVLIFATEYLTGWLLAQIIGRCPWDYRYTSPYHLHGFIRLDYAPVWFIVGLLFEKVHRFLDRIRL